MKFWPFHGLKQNLTEKKRYDTDIDIKPLGGVFSKSLHIFVIDTGNSNALNFTFKALQSPQYNTHRFGIFFTAVPRHADLLIIAGPVNRKMVEPLKETINQMPNQFGILIINGCKEYDDYSDFIDKKHIVGKIDFLPTPDEILAVLLKVANRGAK